MVPERVILVRLPGSFTVGGPGWPDWPGGPGGRGPGGPGAGRAGLAGLARVAGRAGRTVAALVEQSTANAAVPVSVWPSESSAVAATWWTPHAASSASVNAAVYGGEVSLPTSSAPSKNVTLRMPKSSLGDAVSRTVSPRR